MADGTKKMTDEERLALAAKLDKQLDDYINSLPKRKQPQSEPDENWLEEFDKHPFFMKKAPEPGEEMHPLYEGLQKLKYDPDENTPLELANSYKDDGNFNFKHKNYRLAVLSYTEGIKIKCGNDEVEANLYNNRSAANYFLKNYRSCIRDCKMALKLKPDYEKAMIRAANANFEAAYFKETIEYCDKVLERNRTNTEMLELRKKATNGLKNKERDSRKKDAALRKQKKEEEDIIKEIQTRRLNIEECKNSLKLEMLQPLYPALTSHRVFLDEQKHLVWPVAFLIPEYETVDFIQQFCETDLFLDQILNVFSEPPEWDRKKEYKPECLNGYFEYDDKKKVAKVDFTKSLLEILQDKRFIIRGGTPIFIILVKGSIKEKEFLEKYM